MSVRPSLRLFAVLTVIALPATALAGCGDDEGEPPTTTAPQPTTTTTTVPTAPAITDRWQWPAEGEELAATADAAALAFALEFLAIPEPSVVPGDRPPGATSVPITSAPGGPTTNVRVEAVNGGFVVRGADTPLIPVDHPAPQATVTAPVAVAGAADAVEGGITVEIRDRDGGQIGTGFATGAEGTLGPFDTEIALLETYTGPAAAVFFEQSPTGGVLNATVVPIVLDG